MQFGTIDLTGMITGLGWVNLLSGRIRRYRVEFGSATRGAPANPLGRAHAMRPARPRRGFGPNAEFN
jgi:hypothetical protein